MILATSRVLTHRKIRLCRVLRGVRDGSNVVQLRAVDVLLNLGSQTVERRDDDGDLAGRSFFAGQEVRHVH
jgi:hypothetical protein